METAVFRKAHNNYSAALKEGTVLLNEDNRTQRKAKSFKTIPGLTEGKKVISPTSCFARLQAKEGEDWYKFVGKCPRAMFFSANEWEESNPIDDQSLRKMEMGNSIEDMEQRYLERQGYLIGKNIKFLAQVADDMFVSIEIDGLIRDKEYGNVVWECKSTYERGAAEVFGNTTKHGHPRWEYLMQMNTYLIALSGRFPVWRYNEKEQLVRMTDKELEDIYPHYCINPYIDRASGNEKTFIVFTALHKKNNVTFATREQRMKEKLNVLVPGWYDFEHDIVDFVNLSFGAMLDNSNSAFEETAKKGIPSRGPRYAYQDKMVKHLYSIGQVSKLRYAQWEKKSAVVGDYQCIAEGTQIKIGNNWTEIENVKVGDRVMTRTGYRPVTKAWSTGVRKDMLTVDSYYLLPYECTSDHRILISSIPNPTMDKNKKNGKIMENLRFEEAKNIQRRLARKEVLYTVYPISKPNEIVKMLDEELLLLANFITEGNFHYVADRPYYGGFTFGMHEMEHAKRIANLCKKYGATSTNIKIFRDTRAEKVRRSIQLTFCGIELNRYIMSHINGRYSTDRTLGASLMSLSNEQTDVLLKYMYKQDGAVLQMRDSECHNYTTANQKLALQVQDLNIRLKRCASIVYQSVTTEFGTHDSYHVRNFPNAAYTVGRWITIDNQEMLVTRLRSITKSIEPAIVYDLQVEGMPEFLTQGGIVHNCGYCSHHTLCMGRTPWIDATIPTDSDIMLKDPKSKSAPTKTLVDGGLQL